MKEHLVLGTIIGLTLSSMMVEGHHLVDPHTVSVFPGLSIMLAVPLSMFMGLSIIAQRHHVTNRSVLARKAMPFILIASAIFGLTSALLTYSRWSFPTLGIAAFSFLMAATSLIVTCVISALVVARFVIPKSQPIA